MTFCTSTLVNPNEIRTHPTPSGGDVLAALLINATLFCVFSCRDVTRVINLVLDGKQAGDECNRLTAAKEAFSVCAHLERCEKRISQELRPY